LSKKFLIKERLIKRDQLTLYDEYCFPSVKQPKLYEIKSKGPLFGLLSATLSGIVIIHVYKATNVSGYFAIMAQNTGHISSKKIFEIARDAYFMRHPQATKF